MHHSHRNILVALAGQPNAGKSTVFNMLTGVHQHVANFPGVTVEKKQGAFQDGENRVEIIDLPGTYSLTSYSQEERITRDFILLQRPEVVVAVVDASNLERHLYLVFQLLEMGMPMLLCLNMMDVAERRGCRIDCDKLGKTLGIPVITSIARKGVGREQLRRAILEIADQTDHSPNTWRLDYGEPLEPILRELELRLRRREHLMEDFCARWLAVKLMEDDAAARRIVLHHTHDATGPDLIKFVDEQQETMAGQHKKSGARIIASTRFRTAQKIAEECMVCTPQPRATLTDRIDHWACGAFSGFAVAALCLYVAFTLTFSLAQEWRWIPRGLNFLSADNYVAPTQVFDWFFSELMPSLVSGMQPGMLRSLLEDGVIGGVGGVMSFVPVIFFMFVFLAVIEDSGYIARVAFVMDKILRRFGLPGNSVLPLVISGGIAGGCAVPGILATRTLRDRNDRLTTMLVAPFMNCGAKLPAYALLTSAFFAAYKGAMLCVLVVLSWVMALSAAWLLRRTMIKGGQAPLMLELPPYHLPHLQSVLRNAGQRTWMYMRKAGTVILAVNVLLWAMMYFPRADTSVFDMQRDTLLRRPDTPGRRDALAALRYEQDAAQLEASIAGRLGSMLTPVSRLAGFDWRDNIALVGGFAAKEVIVSALSTAYSMGETNPDTVDEEGARHPLARRLKQEPGWTPLRAFAMMLFIMIYAPCFATVVVIWRESESLKWALFSTAYSTTLAFILAMLVYQVGMRIGLG